MATKIIFLHHSTGMRIWIGKTNRYIYKLTKRGGLESYIKKYNRVHKTAFNITHRNFPSNSSYGWNNYPFDYYNIWIKHAGNEPYMGEPTLEILTRNYDIIIFKHCFPVSNIKEDTGSPDINSDEKRLENYKLQYEALKSKMHEFPATKFIIWTPAVKVKSSLTEAEARRTQQFYEWIMNEWDEKGDNIFLWDFYKYETDGGLYMKEEYSSGSAGDSHPSKQFSALITPKFAQYITNVAENKLE
jgi:hypothetical protein